MNVTREAILDFIKAIRILKLPPSNYNAAPTQELPIIMRAGGETVVTTARWGLVPSWASTEKMRYGMINARMETVDTSPAYRAAFKKHRCLVLATGFYEWKKAPQGKQPFRFHRRDDQPFCFAGIWDQRTDQETGEVTETFAIITTSANALVEPVHDRMPVVLAREDWDTWLADTQSAAALKSLLGPWPAQGWEAYPVSKAVNSPTNNNPDLLRRID